MPVTPQRRKRARPPPTLALSIDIPPESPHPLPALLVRVASEENVIRTDGLARAGTVGRSPRHGPSPSPMALRRLSPNHSKTPVSKTPLSLVRDTSWDMGKAQKPLNLPKPAKRSRPTLTLEIPGVAGSSGDSILSLRRQNSWEEGSLADTADEGRACLTGEDAARAEAFVRQLAEMNVKLLAIDFDLTLISMHTGGRWWGSAETLARSVRPMFKTIIPRAMSLGIEVAICTMSQQAHLVSRVMQLSMPRDCDTGKITVRGGEKGRLVTEDGDLDPALGLEGSCKQRHIASVVQARLARGDSNLQPHEVLLIDDDSMNIQEALENGTRGLLFSPDNPMFLFCGIDPAKSFSPAFWERCDSPEMFAGSHRA